MPTVDKKSAELNEVACWERITKLLHSDRRILTTAGSCTSKTTFVFGFMNIEGNTKIGIFLI